MEREILFRGKRSIDKEWVYGSLIITDDNFNEPLSKKKITKTYKICNYIPGDWGLGGWSYDNIISETIGQYSGLKDKEGKKIFEGDIIERDNILWIIKFDEKFGFIAKDMKGFSHIYAWYDRVKVIGNICDNPELVIK